MACWPEEKNIPVLSTRIVDILLTKDIIEIGDEGGKIPFNCYGEDILRLKHNKDYYQIPKYLTCKGTLEFLGFSEKEIDLIWQYVINRKPPSNEPIAPYRAYGFWQGINNYLDTKFKNLVEENKPIQIMDSKQILDAIGLRNDVQLQTLKLTNEGRNPFYICLQNQNPRYMIQWARRYIRRRWSILADLENHISSRPGDGWLLDIVREFNDKPIDLDIAYTMDFFEPLLDLNSTSHIINTTISNEEYSEKEFSDNEAGDLFNW